VGVVEVYVGKIDVRVDNALALEEILTRVLVDGLV
jgi:hypothetical protein